MDLTGALLGEFISSLSPTALRTGACCSVTDYRVLMTVLDVFVTLLTVVIGFQDTLLTSFQRKKKKKKNLQRIVPPLKFDGIPQKSIR